MAFRYDRGTLRPAKILADGRARVDAYLTRSGVFVYRNPDGTERREYRAPAEVFHADSLESLAQVPVTDDHPSEPLTADNARAFARGTVGETIRRDGDKVASSIVIFDAALVAKMRGGKVETSCGYHCDLEDTPGVTPEGESYDVAQKNIRYNHAAIVDIGRAGPEIRVRMDAAIQTETYRQDTAPMDELQKQLAAALMKHGELAAAVAAASVAVAAANARADQAEAARDTAVAARADAVAAFPAAVKSRVALETAAGKILGVDVGGKTDDEIKRAVIAKVDGAELAADKSAAYVDARYDSAIERKPTEILTVKSDGKPAPALDDEAAARAAMNARGATAWNPKGSN